MQKQLRRSQENGMVRGEDEKSSMTHATEKGDLNGEISAAELERLRESERSLLEFLTSQTKQLEQSKVQLEEAKLEMRILRESSGHDEMERLRKEAKLATEAEEKSKKAMDDLAIALKEMASLEKDAQEKLNSLETKYLSARAEADHTMFLLKSSEGRIQSAFEQVRRSEAEAEETAAIWRTKEERFVECIKSLEKENASLRESTNQECHSREQVSKQLRDIMKQAINEATVVKQALEIARNENAVLQESILEKEEALQKLKHELGCIKVSEASAQSSVEELRNLLEGSSRYHPSDDVKLTTAAAELHHQQVEEEEERATPEGGRLLCYGSFRMPSSVDDHSSVKHRRFASTGCICLGQNDGFDGGWYRSDAQTPPGSPTGQRKKTTTTKKKKKEKNRNGKPMLRKFGDMWRSFRK